MNWTFYLDALEIEQPVGWDDVVFNIKRDDTWHGVMFEASTSSLKFYGEAFDYLKAAKESYGVDATVIFTAQTICDDNSTAYVSVLTGKLNFAQYQESCGAVCFISLPVEQADCTMILKNRFDQKVNVDSNVSNGGVILPNYNALGFTMELAAQAIPISADASVEAGGDTQSLTISGSTGTAWSTLVRPVYLTVRDNSILTGELDTPASFFMDPDNFFTISPQVLLEENEKCVSGDWDYTIRLKGSFFITGVPAPMNKTAKLVVGYWDGVTGVVYGDLTILHQTDLGSITSGVTYTFDQTYSGTATIPESFGVYAFLQLDLTHFAPVAFSATWDYTFDPETSFLMSATKTCPPTECKVYMVNELLSRVTESITDRCLTVESEYYGRTDSEPYAQTADGCGSLRVMTSGLRIRQADKDYFLSLKDALDGLRAIDNIGMGIEDDRLRIEPVEYFYNNNPLLTIDLIPKADKNLEENMVYSVIKVGYRKWEIKSVKGIDEINSNKEFHTGIKSVSRTLDITTDLIASGYIIETLRSSTLAVSGNQDSTYDNDSFIICVDRTGLAYSDYEVEQGIIDNPDEMFSPLTVYNWRIRPMYNLMRWGKTIFPSYAVINNTTSKIFFSSGTGNYLAEGNLNVSDDCRLENKVLAENQDLTVNDYGDPLVPIWKPETIEFSYPLSRKDYLIIKADPYGYINVQCGQGEFVKGYIKNISYKPSSGEADFNLILKWQ